MEDCLGLKRLDKSSLPVVARRAKSGLAHQRSLFLHPYNKKSYFAGCLN